MRPERIVAALLGALAAGLIALLVFGPTEGAEAKGAVAETTSTAPMRQTTQDREPAPVPTESEPVPPEPEPAAPTTTARPTPPALPGDGTFAGPVTINLTFPSEVAWRTRRLPSKVPEVRLEARAIAVRGAAGDVHGIECTLGRDATYTFLVDPWNDVYVVDRSNPASHAAVEIARGEAASLVDPPRPNLLALTCVSRASGTTLTLSVNGEPVASVRDDAVAGQFVAVSLTAWSPEGAQEVRFDAVVVETGP